MFCNCEAIVGMFFFFVFCPENISEIIICQIGERLLDVSDRDIGVW